MTDRELLKLVEEGMKVNAPDSPEYIVCAALRARLAQPEPVIYARKEGNLIVADLPQVPRGSGGISKDEQPKPILPGGGIGRHPESWVKTYSGGKPNYTEPCERCGEVNPAEIHTCTPKQREWVWLTDADIDDVQYNVDCRLYRDYARAIEAKLREKNGG